MIGHGPIHFHVRHRGSWRIFRDGPQVRAFYQAHLDDRDPEGGLRECNQLLCTPSKPRVSYPTPPRPDEPRPRR